MQVPFSSLFVTVLTILTRENNIYFDSFFVDVGLVLLRLFESSPDPFFISKIHGRITLQVMRRKIRSLSRFQDSGKIQEIVKKGRKRKERS